MFWLSQQRNHPHFQCILRVFLLLRRFSSSKSRCVEWHCKERNIGISVTVSKRSMEGKRCLLNEFFSWNLDKKMYWLITDWFHLLDFYLSISPHLLFKLSKWCFCYAFWSREAWHKDIILSSDFSGETSSRNFIAVMKFVELVSILGSSRYVYLFLPFGRCFFLRKGAIVLTHLEDPWSRYECVSKMNSIGVQEVRN